MLFLSAIALLGLASCNKTNMVQETPATSNAFTTATLRASQSSYDAAAEKPVVTISGNITSNTTWTADKVYEISGIVAVIGSKTTLTIEPGTFIKAKYLGKDANGNPIPSGVLVITKGTKINAVGTASNPIVFTSYKLLDKDATTSPKPGDFGGIVLLGNAIVNTPVDKRFIEGIDTEKVGANVDVTYGGGDDSDSSGILKYVRIEYAGYELDTDNEINGLTCGGVGSGTTLSHIQVSWGQDDAYEFFGGTVNADHLIAYATDDDSFDFDNGYRGTIRYAVSIANPASTHSDGKKKTDTNGIELDNNSSKQNPNFSLQPKTHPTLEYVTIVGTATREQYKFPDATAMGDAYKYGARIRRGGEITLRNAVILGYPKGLVVDGDAHANVSTFATSYFHGFEAGISPSPITGINGRQDVKVGTPANTFGYKNPFYPAMDFSGAKHTRGAFVGDATWHKGAWTLYR